MTALLQQLDRVVNEALADKETRQLIPGKIQLYLMATGKWTEEVKQDERVEVAVERAESRQRFAGV